MTFLSPPVRGLLLLCLVVASPSALAQQPPWLLRSGQLDVHAFRRGAPLDVFHPSVLAQRPSWLMRPGQLDVHAEGGLSFIPPSFEAGASTEVGVVGLGPGTLSVGAQLGLRQCLLACSLSGVLALERVSTRDVHVLGRLGYHFTWPGKSQGEVDLQGALLGGVMEARILRDAPEFRYEGRGRGLAFGLAVGGNYFLSSRFFVGCEARLRFASGSYALSLTRGSYAFTQEDLQWVRLGLGTVFSAGVRLF